jgi:hypothetical protein
MKNRLARVLLCLSVSLTGTVQAAPPKEASLDVPSRAQSAAPSSPAPTLQPPSQAGERTVLLLGDSLIATGFGRDLETRLDEHPGIRARRRAKSSTGLARPDFFDWMEVGREEVARHKPDVVIVILGGNDGQGLTDEEGQAVAPWGKAAWEAAYRDRIEGFLQVISAPGRKVLWLELPATGLKRFEAKLALIRRVQREVLAGYGEARHLETRPFFTDAKGRPLVKAQVEGWRKPTKLRLEDGVHFTVAGGRYFAAKVYPEVLALLGLGTGEAAPGEAPAPATTTSSARASSSGT